MESTVVDPHCSGSGETAVKAAIDGENKRSESALVTVIASEDKLGVKLHGDTCGAALPEIVIMDTVGGSFSYPSKDTSSSTRNKSRGKKGQRKDRDTSKASVVLIASEGQRAEVASSTEVPISSELKLNASGWIDSSLATANGSPKEKDTAMERADYNPYTSDEWEVDSVDENSDSNDDHTDSSDDDDPKSQVDRLIERGTLMYMDGENSALSSEGESDDDDDSDDYYDSESDITDVSPLVSAAASPLGLSPVLPRRHLATSPLALHSNNGLSPHDPLRWPNPHHRSDNPRPTSEDTLSMDPLLQAVLELEYENKSRTNLGNLNHKKNSKNTTHHGLPHQPSDQMFIHPIRDNPHHHHLRKNYPKRKNMSFSNEEVRKIDHDNKILLRKIMAAHHRVKPSVAADCGPERQLHKPSNASVNRRKHEHKIHHDNALLLKKIQEVKPSKEVLEGRVPSLGGRDPLLSAVVPNHSLRSPTNSCGAFMRSIAQSPHVSVHPPPRKETAL